MKKYIVIALCAFTYSNAFSQTEPDIKFNKYLDYRYSVKLYNEASYAKSTRFQNQVPPLKNREIKTESIRFLHPVFGFQWRAAKGNFHEVQINQFNVTKDRIEDVTVDSLTSSYVIVDAKTILTNISLQYEYILNFRKKENARLVPGVGFGLNGYYYKSNYEPLKTNFLAQTNTDAGIRIFINPRLTYFFSGRFFLDASLPVCFSNMYMRSEKISDPAVPSNQQKLSTGNFELFPGLVSARLGLGFKF